MSRPTRSINGYIRSMQISKYDLMVFVEGKENDSYFYGNICDKICTQAGIARQIRTAKELPFQSGGKKSLIDFYKVLRTKKKLVSSLNNKTTKVVFFLDKDVDDILGIKCRSHHVIYTKYYDVQNHIFSDSNFINGVSSAASIDPAELRNSHMFCSNWCVTAASRWREWVKLCLFVQKHRVNGVNNYRICSAINTPLNGTLDPVKYSDFKSNVINSLGITADDFDEKYAVIETKVDKMFRSNTHNIVFKGKWYSTLLELDLRTEFAGRNLHLEKIAQRAVSALASTLDFGASWVDHFTVPLQKVISI